MKLLTKAIEKKLPKLYSTESIPLEKKKIICKFFNPVGPGNWYIIEGEKKGDDYLLWGLIEIHPQKQEFGYFTLSSLQKLLLPYGMKIERDRVFKNRKLSNVLIP